MLTLSAQATATLSRSHRVAGRLRASVNGSAFTYPVSLVSGTVTVNAGSPIRRTLTATVQARVGAAEVDPFRTELRAEYGVELTSGQVEWVPVGTFVVTDVTEQPGPRGQVVVQGVDRWQRVVDARLLTPVQTSGSTIAAITQLLLDADRRITVVDQTGSGVTHTPSTWDRDRDKAVLELAKSLGVVVAFDPSGVAVIRRPPQLTDSVVWRLPQGEGGAVVDVTRSMSRAGTYNAAVAEGEPTDGSPPVRGIAVVTDGASPLLWGGVFGSRPRFYRSPLINTQGQAQAAADALLARVTGRARTLKVDVLPHPGLDGDDILQVEVDPGVWERHVVDGFTLPLGPGSVSLATRLLDVAPPDE